MKLVAQEEQKKKADDEVRLALKSNGIGGVVLYVVDAEGKCHPGGNLLEVLSDGTINRCSYVDSELGFRLEEGSGCVVITRG